MLNRFKQVMLHQYFGKQFPLDYRIYMIFFFESFFLSILSAATNTALNKGLPGLILQWAYVAFCIVLLFVIPRIRLALQKPHLLFITFFYIPFLYFQTAGYHGTALLFASLGFFLLGIVFKGKARIALITLNILDYLACILISHFYPQTVVPHSGSDAMLIDLIVAVVLSFVGLSILTLYISRVFEDNRKTLSELSVRDALTGVYNRRFLNSFLQNILDTSRKKGDKFYVLMLDIDHFKYINDTYGHVFGDHVLLACVQAIQSILRKGDIIARYGGEEFAVILFPRRPNNAVDIAERIRRMISSLRFHYNVTVTVSIGVARSRPEDTIEALLDRADQYMYCAKQSGRNQVAAGV
ncbi:MAG: GGDEF domain-containing protein [Christensenellales bacterium]|jgi:diguanylate cyclase (GGDEF)-like protein